MTLVRKSKALSKYLRHTPGEIGLTLEDGGWVKVNDLLRALKKRGIDMTFEELDEVVSTNDKKRFSFNEDKTKIRAAQGHSVEVDLKLVESAPPLIIYHGTNNNILSTILREGVKPMTRQHVHLTTSKQTAFKTGSRKGKPVVLRIMTQKMLDEGHKFYLADNGVWLTDFVPADCIVGHDYE